MTRRVALALTLTALTLTAGGCGYALAGRGGNIPEEVQDVYLAPFENQTQRSQVEQFVTQAIATELVKRRRFSIVNSAESADAQLTGTVTAFGVTPVSFDNDGRATEYEISITAAVEFRRLDTDEVLWSNSRYLFRENYPVDDTSTSYFDRENDAIEEAAERFADIMVSDLLVGF